MLGISIAFVMFVLINLPFIDTIQNYRTVAIQVTMLYILLVANYYRSMKSNTPL